MTDRRKNLFVGATVLAGLILLGWMILQFGGVAISPFTSGRYSVIVTTDRADGIGEGSAVLYRGISVGQVKTIRMSDDMARVVLTLSMNADSRVPENVDAIIRPQGLIGGGGAVFLELKTPTPTGRLMGGQELHGQVGDLQLLPKEFTALAEEIRQTSAQFRESGVIKHLDEAVVNISDQANRAGEVLQSVQKLVGDPRMKQDIDRSLANINEVTQTAKSIAANLDKFSSSLERTGGNLDRLTSEATDTMRDTRSAVKNTQASIDQVTRQVADRLTQLSGVLESMGSVTRKIDQGKGTAGMIVNDPRLYEALVDSAKQLNATLADLKRVVEQWEQEGVSLKVR